MVRAGLMQSAVLGLLLMSLTQSGKSTTLTGAALFDVNAAGNAGTQFWNTLGGDAFRNLYLVEPPLNIFVNSGNGPGASLNVPLTAGVNYVFIYWAQPGTGTNFGLNLFFNGDSSSPRISGLVPGNSTSFTVNSSASTKRLDGTNVAAAGTAMFVDGGTSITLAAFTNFASLTDRVQDLDNSPGGGPDFTGFITLSVTEVPEPGTAALSATALTLAMLAVCALKPAGRVGPV